MKMYDWSFSYYNAMYLLSFKCILVYHKARGIGTSENWNH